MRGLDVRVSPFALDLTRSAEAMRVMPPFWSWRAALGGRLALCVRVEPEQGREKIGIRVIFKQRQQLLSAAVVNVTIVAAENVTVRSLS